MCPAPRHIALTGVPRSGTTLCCHLLDQADDTVALFEPMPVHELPPGDGDAATCQVERYFSQSRRMLLDERSAWSQQVDGRVPDNPFGAQRGEGGRRTRESTHGRITVDKPLSGAFTLIIKHNAAFTALLPQLAQRIETVAVVRNPLAVLASWHSVDLPVSRGRIPAGERLDAGIAQRLAAIDGVLDRQLAILDWFFGRFAAHLPRARVVRYEDVVASGGAALGAACGIALPITPLQARNSSPLYDATLTDRLATGLLAGPGAWQQFYREDDIEALAGQLATARAP